MHFEKLETKQTPYVVEQLPETTIVPSETSSLFFTPPPSTSSPFGFIHTETQRPVEPQTFPTLVYVPREESKEAIVIGPEFQSLEVFHLIFIQNPHQRRKNQSTRCSISS